MLRGKGRGGSCREQRSRVSVYCMRTSTIPTTSDYEEDFGDFPKELLVGAYRAESTFDYLQEVESQHKFHHFLMGQHPGSNTKS